MRAYQAFIGGASQPPDAEVPAEAEEGGVPAAIPGRGEVEEPAGCVDAALQLGQAVLHSQQGRHDQRQQQRELPAPGVGACHHHHRG